MKNRLNAVLLCALLCGLLTGCEVLPYPRELEDTLLVRVLGVDWTGEEVALTAAGEPRDGEESKVLTAEGTSPEESHQSLKEAGEEYVALTHVTQIVVGENSDLRAVLEGALVGKEVGQTATVWLVREGTARALMEEVKGGAKRLTSIELNTAGLTPRTVLDALAELERYHEVDLPTLSVKDGRLEMAGMTVWKEEMG